MAGCLTGDSSNRAEWHGTLRCGLLLEGTLGPLRRDGPRFVAYADQAIERSLTGKTFEEVVYGEVAEVRGEDMRPKVHACLDNLLASERFRWLLDEAAPASGEWIIDPPGHGETRLGDLKVYIKVDVLFPLDDLIHILDWKTGKADPVPPPSPISLPSMMRFQQ